MIKVNGTWMTHENGYIKINGEWIPIKLGYVKIDGRWQLLTEFGRTVTDMPIYNQLGAAVYAPLLYGKNVIWIICGWGGTVASENAGMPSNEVWIYDIELNTYTQRNSISGYSAAGIRAEYLEARGARYIYVFGKSNTTNANGSLINVDLGGYAGNGGVASNSSCFGLALDEENKKFYVSGGKLQYNGSATKDNSLDSKSTELYEYMAEEIEIAGPYTIPARAFHTSVFYQGQVFLFGGLHTKMADPGNSEIYNPTTRTVTTITSLPDLNNGDFMVKASGTFDGNQTFIIEWYGRTIAYNLNTKTVRTVTLTSSVQPQPEKVAMCSTRDDDYIYHFGGMFAQNQWFNSPLTRSCYTYPLGEVND